ncbi:conserved hypothetical protein [Trichinella spiralis]|uniref:hypothetical protein n=1 Tax=Trichinella spiralis TaxID=6334 RepID=UPI0001EFDEC0|nr:conserved hypothetical protein [Trichinella spiralis]
MRLACKGHISSEKERDVVRRYLGVLVFVHISKAIYSLCLHGSAEDATMAWYDPVLHQKIPCGMCETSVQSVDWVGETLLLPLSVICLHA